jgi:arsenate reductase
MNIQIYQYKKNFDVQKAQRFFKERNIPFQIVDMKKHRPGERELALFAHKGGAKSLIDEKLPQVKEHPISYTDDESRIFDYLQEHPEFIKTPIIRDGRRILIGYDEQTLLEWIKEVST